MTRPVLPLPTFETPSERVLLLRFGDAIERSCNDRVQAAAQALRDPAMDGLLELIPAYATLAIHYEPSAWLDENRASSIVDNVIAAVTERLSSMDTRSLPNEFRLVEIPVCHDHEFGLDLPEAADELGLGVEEIVARHCAGNYRVAMLGFAPGFPYLLGLDSGLHLPRRSQPRLRVPSGSVAIGGAQTGIYPSELPGGWQLIGRTPLQLFDPRRDPPQLLNPGDRVRFVAIQRVQFNAMSASQA